MRRGEIRWIALDAPGSRHTRAQRPAVIVSNDGANAAAARRGAGVVTVVPLITSSTPPKAFHVAIPAGVAGLPRDAKAVAEQVRTVASGRVGPSIGTVPITYMHHIDEALRRHLGL